MHGVVTEPSNEFNDHLAKKSGDKLSIFSRLMNALHSPVV
jgi:hypothetical protein